MSYPTLDAFAFAPVVAGLWRQHELSDGTYDFDDLLDAHELLAVKAENARRMQDAMRKEQADEQYIRRISCPHRCRS